MSIIYSCGNFVKRSSENIFIPLKEQSFLSILVLME